MSIFERGQIVIMGNPSMVDFGLWLRYYGYHESEIPVVRHIPNHPHFSRGGIPYEICMSLDAYTPDLDLRPHPYLDDAKMRLTWEQLTGLTYPVLGDQHE